MSHGALDLLGVKETIPVRHKLDTGTLVVFRQG